MTPASTAVEPLLEVTDLRVQFDTEAGVVHAVNGVSFTLGQGRTLGIVGESGSGKSVLSRAVMRLETSPSVRTQGSVRYRSEELVGRTPRQMRDLWGAEIAMVFQDPMTALNPVVRIGRQLTEHLRRHLGVSKQEADALAVALLRSVRLPEPEQRMKAYPHELSGGMRQRVGIAMAIACRPNLILADEPTTALDVSVQHQILNLLRQEQRELDTAMILVTHDLGVVAGRTDEAAVMYAGQIVEKAPTARLFGDVRMPYTQALLRAVPRMTEPKHTRLFAIEGRPPDLLDPPRGCKFSPRCPYVQPRCREEEPPLTATEDDSHVYACWYPVNTPAGRGALETNLDAGVPQALAVADTLEPTGADALAPTEAGGGWG